MKVEKMRIFDWFFFLLGNEPVYQRNQVVESVCKYEIVAVYREENENVNDLKT